MHDLSTQYWTIRWSDHAGRYVARGSLGDVRTQGGYQTVVDVEAWAADLSSRLGRECSVVWKEDGSRSMFRNGREVQSCGCER